MEIVSIAMNLLSTMVLTVGMFERIPEQSNGGNHAMTQHFDMDKPETYAAILKCKAGLKAGKTPMSLVPGVKVSCYNITSAAAGKKLLTTDFNKSCASCHSRSGIAPASKMNSNLRAQGFTLKPASITAAFNTHIDQMFGSVLTAKDAKLISNYLQSIK